MAAEDSASNLIGYKAVSVFPGNVSKGLNPHQGVVALLDPATGALGSLLEGSALTALRTAAASAAAAELLARADSSHLALVGTGLQALEHARAFSRIRTLRKITIYGRNRKNAEALAARLSDELGVEVDVALSARDAVALADLVVTATPARDFLFSTLDLAVGAHLTAVGACRPGMREVNFAPRCGLGIFVDSRAACAAEAEELRESQCIRGEIGSVFLGSLTGRSSPSDITVFKSVGLGIEDVAAARFFVDQAMRQGVGQGIEL